MAGPCGGNSDWHSLWSSEECLEPSQNHGPEHWQLFWFDPCGALNAEEITAWRTAPWASDSKEPRGSGGAGRRHCRSGRAQKRSREQKQVTMATGSTSGQSGFGLGRKKKSPGLMDQIGQFFGGNKKKRSKVSINDEEMRPQNPCCSSADSDPEPKPP